MAVADSSAFRHLRFILILIGGIFTIGTTLKDSPIRKEIGLIVVAIKDTARHMHFNPPADYTIEPGNVLICIGDDNALHSMQALASGHRL